jgi:hypothetical protein
MDAEKRCRELEEKTEKLAALLDSITREFDELQSLMSEPCCLPNARIRMNKSKKEDELLVTGWYASEKGFRWGGKDRQHPEIVFNVSLGKSYRLDMKIFVPEAIAGSKVRIVANDTEIDSFVSEGQVEKSVHIPDELLKSGRLKIVFKSDFWDPSIVDKSLESRTLSMAFNYIELIES